jgi:hypothetical protein
LLLIAGVNVGIIIMGCFAAVLTTYQAIEALINPGEKFMCAAT